MLSLENGLQSAIFLKPTFQTVLALPGIAAIGVHICLLVWKMPFWAMCPLGLAWCPAHGRCLVTVSGMEWTGPHARRIATQPQLS